MASPAGVLASGVGWGEGMSTGRDDGQFGGGASLLPIVSAGYGRPAAERSGDDSAAGPGPDWAVPQLCSAVEIATRREGSGAAATLFTRVRRRWPRSSPR